MGLNVKYTVVLDVDTLAFALRNCENVLELGRKTLERMDEVSLQDGIGVREGLVRYEKLRAALVEAKQDVRQGKRRGGKKNCR